MIKPIPKPISGGLILSYKCPSACRHCIYACSPQWSADWMPEEMLENILSQLAGKILPAPYGPDTTSLNHGLHFTGGEPFVNFPLLCHAVELATQLGIPSTFVETNAYWCLDDRSTREKLDTLKRKGLRGILISVNPFYLEYVPCKLKEFLRSIYPLRRAQAFVHEPCLMPFLRPLHNHFDNYGNYVPGFCAGVTLGDCRKLDELLREGVDTARFPVLGLLMEEDLKGLLALARERGFQESAEGYYSKCHLCMDLRKHLALTGDYPELSPREFYLQLGSNS
jgi:hypothetical protein